MQRNDQQALKSARRLLVQRRPNAAYELCREILAGQPDHAGALALAGAALGAAGQASAAIEHLRRALSISPELVDAQVDLALALRASGQHEKALRRIERAAGLHPENVSVLNTYGLLLSGAGEPRRAAQVLDKAWRASGLRPGIGYNLGEAQRKAGDLIIAARTFEAVLQRHPGDAPCLNSLGLVLLAQGQHEAAADRFRAALVTRPQESQFILNLARALERAGRIGEAVEALRIGLRGDSRDVPVILELARIYTEVEEPEAARDAYRRVIKMDPANVRAYRRLAWLEEQSNCPEAAEKAAAEGLRIQPDDPGLIILEARRIRLQGDPEAARARLASLPEAALETQERVSYYHELGHIADAGGDGATAWSHFTRRGDLFADLIGALAIDPEHYPRLADNWGGTLEAMAPCTIRSPDSPVFVVGFPRSGTTLLDQFLGGHPDLLTMEEKPALDAVVALAGELGLTLPQNLAGVSAHQADQLRRRYWQAAASYVTLKEGHRLVDRLPANVLYLPLIQNLWPGAPVIFAARDPLDACLSCLMQDFRPNPLTANLAAMERCVPLYSRFADLWIRFEGHCRGLSHIVRYEDLVAAPEDQCLSLVSFLGLQWDPAMLDHVATARSRRALRTASYHQVVQPLYLNARQRWRRYREQLQPWREALAPYRQYFGYADE